MPQDFSAFMNLSVKQGCILSPFLFILAINWLLKQTAKENRNCMTLMSGVEDLDYADDTVKLSSQHKDAQEKII